MKIGRLLTGLHFPCAPVHRQFTRNAILRLLRQGRSYLNSCTISALAKYVCATALVFIVAATIVSISTAITGNSVFGFNWAARSAIDKLCERFIQGQVSGDLCEDLCGWYQYGLVPSERWPVSPHLAKEVAFVAERRGSHDYVFVKSKFENIDRFERYPYNLSAIDVAITQRKGTNVTRSNHLAVYRSQFNDAIASLVFHNFNSVGVDAGFDPLGLIDLGKDQPLRPPNENDLFSLWLLAQQKEYLLFKLYEPSQLFPTVLSTCGHFYATQHLTPLSSLLHLSWTDRLELIAQILRLLERAQTAFPSVLRLCDVKLDHFGVLNFGGNDSGDGALIVRLLDGDDVYFQSVLDGFQRRGNGNNECRCDRDCSFFDCRVRCDPASRRCDARTANNNMQAVCEKILVPRPSALQRLLQPGFLHSAPAVLATRMDRLTDVCRYDGRQSEFYELLRTVKEILTID